jgi:hypothetical protein
MQLKTNLIIGGCLVFICCFIQCKGDSEPVNIVLYNQPVSVIKQYISGKWILHYDIGGLDGKTRHNYTNSFFEFKFNAIDSIIRQINGVVDVKSSINWFRYQDIFTGDSIYLLGFSFYTGVPFNYRVSEIKDDTLVITDPVADGYQNMLTKY